MTGGAIYYVNYVNSSSSHTEKSPVHHSVTVKLPEYTRISQLKTILTLQAHFEYPVVGLRCGEG